ncbi:MAG: hypothetical protein ACYS5V_09055 [Planctomycetota bacterium]
MGQLRRLAVGALARMYRPAERLFAHHLRRDAGSDVLEGVSRRYTATVLIGLAGEGDDVAAAVLAGDAPSEVCGALVERVEEYHDLGEVALTVWAARLLDHPDAAHAVDRLARMSPAERAFPTVELAWALTALVVEGAEATDVALSNALAERLIASFDSRSGLFSHWPKGAKSCGLRSHVTCFADFVYPVQSLSYYHLATGDDRALETACACADRMCRLQGSEGQWWWHFDVRTGRLLEPFPVYSVHQDSMAPMALRVLERASGRDYSGPIARGLAWLVQPPEISGSLIDVDSELIWRKVARREPGKLARGLQAAASRAHPMLRMPALNLLLRPGAVDYETRPYHMGWILHAWPPQPATA